jgi:gamma-glutamyltranspeptidase
MAFLLLAAAITGAGWSPGAATTLPPAQQATLHGWIEHPVYGPDGRLAFALDGDIWVSGERRGQADLRADELRQVTSGPDWDRDPAWSPDGDSIVFASDRGGSTNLWRAMVDGDGRASGTAQLTAAGAHDTQPTVAPDGTIVFVRGRDAVADLWWRTADGTEEALKEAEGTESGPMFSADGERLLYIAGRAIHVVTFDEDGAVDEDEAVVTGMTVAAAAWSPDGERIVFTTQGGSPGVYVAPSDGRFSNLIAEVSAAPAWSPDGERIALAELAPNGPGYNGDPDRVGDRAAGDMLSAPADKARFWLVDAPAQPVTEPEPLALAPRTDRAAYNGEAFDRVWQRMADVYYEDGERAAQWQQSRATYRPRAVAASSQDELEAVIHEMLRDRPTARDEVHGRAAVSSAHPIATAAGVEILEAGGNVVDAAVAVSFALGVVEPDASGLGGYGQMLVYLNGMDKPVVISFLTRAPQQATLENGYLDNASGPMLANVPGVPRGMELAFERYGSGDVEWSDVVQPAIRAARDGFVMDDAFTTTLSLERDRYAEWDSSMALFFPGGEPLQPGDTFENPDLAWTLEQIAEGGADAFYEGVVARRIVEDLRGKGNAMTMNDMARYFAVERPAVVGEYRGYTVYTATPPVSGGVSLVAKLNLLNNFSPMELYTEDAASLHAMVEASKLQPRSRVADPDLWPVDISDAVDAVGAERRWNGCFDPEHALTPDDLRAGRGGMPECAAEQEQVASVWYENDLSCQDTAEGCHTTGTTAFTVADADGNFVAVTQTLGTWGGNFYVTPGVGFLYNDKLRSYGSNPTGFGARLPYARNSTSISPTLVFRGIGDDQRPYLAVGAAGNAWIGAAVYSVVTGMIDGGLGPQRALELPRFLLSGGGRGGRGGAGGSQPAVITAEDIIAPDVVRALRAMGHDFQMISLRGEMRMGYGAAVMIGDGEVVAGADPRRSGAAQAVQR